MIVVDTNVLVYLWLRDNTGLSRQADEVRRRDNDWASSALWEFEFRNVLASHLRFRTLSLEEAKRLAVRSATALSLRVVPSRPSMVLDLVARSGLTAYDCEFVAAAQVLETMLVTGDRALARAFPEMAVTMEEFVGM